MRHRLLAWILGGACLLALFIPFERQTTKPRPDAVSQALPATTPTQSVDYHRDILPILSGKCFACHGLDAGSRKAGVRLDVREWAMKPARSGETPIKPGNSAESEVVRRIFSGEDGERMPPIKGGKPLTENEKELLKRWIDQGAQYSRHWAFVQPKRPEVPLVRDKTWPKNAIDAFVLHRLEKEGLRPSPCADRATLIRRLSLDLRGLPPSLQEVDAFLADTSADAYEKLVDRMLASPRYGEKMTQVWLDLARFGDTSGYHLDSNRQMWMWRDWVIDAFNKNMPFDQFTIEQLAGDLLPGATVEQKIASGFNRNTRFNEEGGVDPEEYVVRYTIDRTNTLGQVWLGLTLGCAECHSHKYDPIAHKEYYQIFAYFAGIAEPMTSGNHGLPLPPLLRVPTPKQNEELKDLRDKVAEVEAALSKEVLRIDYQDPLAGKGEAAEPRANHQDIVWIDDEVPFGAKTQGMWTWSEAPRFPVHSGKKSMRRTGPELHQHYFLGAANPLPISKGDNLFAYVWLDPQDPPKSIMFQWNDGEWEHRAYWGADKCLLEGAPNGPDHFHAGALPALGQWVRLEIAADKIGLKPGASLNGMSFTQFEGTVHYDCAGVSSLDPFAASYPQSQIAWEKKAKNDSKLPAEVRTALQSSKSVRGESDKKTLRDYYLRKIHEGSRERVAPLEEDLELLTTKLRQTEDAIPHTLVSAEMPTPRPAYVLLRGDFLNKGEKVDRGVPAVFPPLPSGQPNNRLGLARWLVSADHPLTARVAVNRLWTQMFGQGIVRSLGDFGSQGDYPAHPELLDWLATEFIRTGWDMKAMLRLMALSATYRQSSVFSPTTVKADPDNRLISRAARHRLGAEEIRDSVLAISGLLSDKIGGPSFMPYQPSEFYTGKNEKWFWKSSEGEEQYRRGIYAFWRRNSLHPMFAIFDAPTREECSVARPRTNTPLQALVTLNDPTFVEAARVFAQKILTQGPKDLDGRLTFAFRAATCRRPSAAELQVLRHRYRQQYERFRLDQDAASKFVNVGQFPRDAGLDVAEHAAWTAVANMLLNLDEVLSRE